MAVPERARVVVVGGGVIGCSVAYHLAHMGWNDVVLLERDRLTSGTTWHAAGLMVTFGSTSETSTEMRKYTRDLYARLEAETGLATGLQAGRLHRGRRPTRTGSRSTAGSPRSTATAASTCTRSRRARSKELFPLARTDDILAGFYVAEDGRANPVDVTMALAKGARHAGRDDHRGRAGHRRPARSAARVTGVRTPLRRHRGRVRRQLRRHVGAPARRAGRASTSRCRRPSTTT